MYVLLWLRSRDNTTSEFQKTYLLLAISSIILLFIFWEVSSSFEFSIRIDPFIRPLWRNCHLQDGFWCFTGESTTFHWGVLKSTGEIDDKIERLRNFTGVMVVEFESTQWEAWSSDSICVWTSGDDAQADHEPEELARFPGKSHCRQTTANAAERLKHLGCCTYYARRGPYLMASGLSTFLWILLFTYPSVGKQIKFQANLWVKNC